MKTIRKDLVFLAIVCSFLGALLGSSQAKNFYYFDVLPGLIIAG